MQINNNQIELKAECKAIDDGNGVFEGYASTFGNVDKVSDVVAKGAFEESLANLEPKVLWQHDMYKPVAKLMEAYEDDKGLYIKAKMAKTSLGNDALQLMRDGIIDKMSIGFRVVDSEFDVDRGVRILKKIQLIEFSLVTIPANDDARIMAVKELPRDMRTFERFLRGAGFSRKDATAITQHGFTGYLNQCETDEDNPSLKQCETDEVKTLLNQLLDTMRDSNVRTNRGEGLN